MKENVVKKVITEKVVETAAKMGDAFGWTGENQCLLFCGKAKSKYQLSASDFQQLALFIDKK